MFSLFSTTLLKCRHLCGATDSHCHILPGVDDGVPTMDDALAILADYESLGVSTVWLTPHIMEDIPNTTAELRQRYDELKAAYHGSVTLHLAAEYMLDGIFDQRFKARDLLTHHDGSLLVETSYFTPPMGLYNTLDEIRRAGYSPILAHPERYVYMDDSAYRRLRHMGVVFQLNLFALSGQYGPTAKKKAMKLLRDGYYTLFGTDLHRHQALARNLGAKIPKSAAPLLENLK